MSGMGRTAVRVRMLMALVVACATLLALFAVGCSGGAGSAADQKAMREAVAKFYSSQGELDIEGMKASLYDPQNIAGLATATVPPEAQKTEVVVKSVGETIVISVPSQELTLTLSAAKTPPNAVTMSAPGGQTDTLIMKKDGGVWKIDVAETEKLRQAQAPQPTGQGAPSEQAPSGQAPSGQAPSGQTAP